MEDKALPNMKRTQRNIMQETLNQKWNIFTHASQAHMAESLRKWRTDFQFSEFNS